MAVYEIAPNRAGAPLARPVELICFALIVAQAVYLAASWWTGTWLVAADGTGVASDFVNVWAAGKLVWQGTPAAAYDWPVHKAMEVVAVGHPFDGYFGWHYPPTFLFVAAMLSLLPYAGAYVVVVVRHLPALSRRYSRNRRQPRRLHSSRGVSGGAVEFHRRAERLSHRGVDRRRACHARRTADPRRSTHRIA